MNLNRYPNDPRNLLRNVPAAQRANKSWPREGRRGTLPRTSATKTFRCMHCGFGLPDYEISRAAVRQMFANPQATCCRSTECVEAYTQQLTTEL